MPVGLKRKLAELPESIDLDQLVQIPVPTPAPMFYEAEEDAQGVMQLKAWRLVKHAIVTSEVDIKSALREGIDELAPASLGPAARAAIVDKLYEKLSELRALKHRP